MASDEDFPKLRDSTRPNIEWLKAPKPPTVKPKNPDGRLVNLRTGDVVKVREIIELDGINPDDL